MKQINRFPNYFARAYRGPNGIGYGVKDTFIIWRLDNEKDYGTEVLKVNLGVWKENKSKIAELLAPEVPFEFRENLAEELFSLAHP